MPVTPVSQSNCHTEPTPIQQILPDLLQWIAKQDGVPSLAQISERSGYSEAYLHREFRRFSGMALKQYLRLIQLQRAAMALVYRQHSITELALQAGYQHSESFSRAFLQWLGVSPREFRERPNWQHWQAQLAAFPQLPLQHDLPDWQIVCRPVETLLEWHYQGPRHHFAAELQQFIAWRRANQLPPNRFRTFNLLYDNQHLVQDSDWQFGLAVAVPITNQANQAHLIGESRRWLPLPELDYLRLPVVGPDTAWQQSLMQLLQQTLPAIGRSAAKCPLLLERIKFYPDVPSQQAENILYLPLQPHRGVTNSGH